VSLHFHNLYRLLLDLIERMRLVFDFPEVNIHKVYAPDVAVPGSSIVEFHGSLISS
jgi:hypothetical protein